jgi:hypothetical protein
MSSSFSFSNASTSRLTLLSSHTSRNSRFNSFVLITSSVIRSRRSFSRSHHNLFNNSLFISSFILSDCLSSFNFAFSFSSSLSSTRLSLSSNLRDDQESNMNENQESNTKKNQKSNSKEDQESYSNRKQKFSRITRESSIVEKTQIVLKYMRNLRLTFFDFVLKIVKTNSMHKQSLVRKLELLRSLVLNLNDVLNLVNWKREEYRRELCSLIESRYFKNWKIDDTNLLETNSTMIIKKIKNRASRSLTLLRYIIATMNQRFDRENMKAKWIIIIFILCFIFKSRTCVRWSTMWDIQLHANEIKRRIIQCLFQSDLTIEYKEILNSFRELARFQMTSLKTLNVENKFIIIWNNFEQIKTMKHQRIDNKDEFFSIIIAQIFEFMWMFSRSLHQDMFDQIAKLNWRLIAKHESLNVNSSLFKTIN